MKTEVVKVLSFERKLDYKNQCDIVDSIDDGFKLQKMAKQLILQNMLLYENIKLLLDKLEVE